MNTRFIVSATLFFMLWATHALAQGSIDFLSLPEKDFGVQDATKVSRENDSLTVYGIRALAASRVPIDALQYRNFSLVLRSSSDATGFLFWGKGSQVRLHPFVIEKSGEPKKYEFDLWTFPDFRGSLAVFGFGFQHPLGEEQSVTILRMMIEEERSSPIINGMKQFFVPEFITFPSINVFFGPRLWGKSFTTRAFVVFIFAGVSLIILSLFSKKISWRKSATIMFGITMCAWVVFDARNILNLFAIAKKDVKGFVVSPRYEKTYDNLQDLYGFLHFVEDNVPQNSSLSFASSFGMAYQLRAEYVLRPREVTLGIPKNPVVQDFLVLYRYPAQIDGKAKIMMIGKTRFPYKGIIPFRENSLIVKMK